MDAWNRQVGAPIDGGRAENGSRTGVMMHDVCPASIIQLSAEFTREVHGTVDHVVDFRAGRVLECARGIADKGVQLRRRGSGIHFAVGRASDFMVPYEVAPLEHFVELVVFGRVVDDFHDAHDRAVFAHPVTRILRLQKVFHKPDKNIVGIANVHVPILEKEDVCKELGIADVFEALVGPAYFHGDVSAAEKERVQGAFVVAAGHVVDMSNWALWRCECGTNTPCGRCVHGVQ